MEMLPMSGTPNNSMCQIHYTRMIFYCYAILFIFDIFYLLLSSNPLAKYMHWIVERWTSRQRNLNHAHVFQKTIPSVVWVLFLTF